MLIESRYKPPGWLKNCHLQTIIGTRVGRDSGVTTLREQIELPDGDFLHIDWLNHQVEQSQPTLIILHGLEGSIDSSYIQSLLSHYVKTDWRVGVMHFRGCSGVTNRLLRSYHSGDTGDLHRVLSQLNHQGPLLVAGFSLGGNVLLKYLGEQGGDALINAAVAVSVPFDLADAAITLDKGFAKFYRWHLLRDVKQKARIKRTMFPDYDWISESDLNGLKSFVDFDHLITAPIHGFESGADYYERCSCTQFLSNIQIPTLIIHAKDDPFMTQDAIPKAEELSDQIQLELTPYGGHMGFLQQSSSGRFSRYQDERISGWFEQQI